MTFRDAPVDEAPKRGRSSSRRTTPRPSTRSLRKEIDGLVNLLNSVVGVVAPRDALDSIEVAALVHAIDEEAKINPRFRKGLETILGVTGGGSLMMVVSMIAARRVARHVIPQPIGQIVDDAGAFALSTLNAEPSEAAESMQSIVDMFRNAGNNNGHASATDNAAESG